MCGMYNQRPTFCSPSRNFNSSTEKNITYELFHACSHYRSSSRIYNGCVAGYLIACPPRTQWLTVTMHSLVWAVAKTQPGILARKMRHAYATKKCADAYCPTSDLFGYKKWLVTVMVQLQKFTSFSDPIGSYSLDSPSSKYQSAVTPMPDTSDVPTLA